MAFQIHDLLFSIREPLLGIRDLRLLLGNAFVLMTDLLTYQPIAGAAARFAVADRLPADRDAAFSSMER